MISEVTNECNMVMMARYPDKFFDLAIVDPPYGIGEGKVGRNMSRATDKDGNLRKVVDKRNGSVSVAKPKKYKESDWDISSPDKNYFDELIRVSKNQIIWGANHFISKIPYNSSSWIVWDKINGKTDFADCELAYTSFKTAVRQFRFMWSGWNQSADPLNPELMQGKSQTKKNPEYTLPKKPVKLYEWLLMNYAEPGQKILDTHLGSQSSRIAAHNLCFDFWGCELDKDYFDEGCKRFNNHILQQRLF